MLIKCSECGNSISDKANSCPHCGAPNTHKKTFDETAPLYVYGCKEPGIINPSVKIYYGEQFLGTVDADDYVKIEGVEEGMKLTFKCWMRSTTCIISTNIIQLSWNRMTGKLIATPTNNLTNTQQNNSARDVSNLLISNMLFS